MLRVLVAAFALIALSTGGPAAPARPAPGHRFDLKRELDARLSRYGSPAWRTGIAVYSCSRDSLVYGSGENMPLSPASCQKLFVTAAALEHWDSALVRRLDARLDSTDLRAHLHRVNRKFVDSLGLNARPDFPGYRHLVLANRESDNSEAEWMLDILSRRRGLAAPEIIKSFLDSRGISRPGLRIWDACGLSHRNRTTAGTLGKLLVSVYESQWRELFMSTLAIPGRPGTLIKRNLDVGPHVAAKTGFIRDVFSLSGFLYGQTDTFAFSFVVNGCGSGTRAYDLFNSLLGAVYSWDAGEQAVLPAAAGVAGSGASRD